MDTQHDNMQDENGDRRLRTALFVDFDNIYISLLSKDREAATRFATDPVGWTTALAEGKLCQAPVSNRPANKRRLIIARVYGNPVTKSKDRTGFAFVRSHFMHAGYEVIDCPPLTNQMKNGSDIRMVLDMRDYLDHEPPIDEFIVMSGDSDFVPILLRLRSHDRLTTIYGSVQTAKSYTAIADRVITEEKLIAHLTQRQPMQEVPGEEAVFEDPLAAARREIIEEVAKIVEASDKPVPMELLATSVRNAVGLKRTIDTKWAGHGQFSALLAEALSREFVVSDKPPYMVWHREIHSAPPQALGAGEPSPVQTPEPPTQLSTMKVADKMDASRKASARIVVENILKITKIPALTARYYQRLFQLIADEISENGFVFARTAEQAAERGRAMGLPVDPAHVQEMLHRIRRQGHWFSESDTARGLARVFRDSVIAECMEGGLTLTGPQLDLIESWFIPRLRDGDEAMADEEFAAIAGVGRVEQPVAVVHKISALT